MYDATINIVVFVILVACIIIFYKWNQKSNVKNQIKEKYNQIVKKDSTPVSSINSSSTDTKEMVRRIKTLFACLIEELQEFNIRPEAVTNTVLAYRNIMIQFAIALSDPKVSYFGDDGFAMLFKLMNQDIKTFLITEPRDKFVKQETKKMLPKLMKLIKYTYSGNEEIIKNNFEEIGVRIKKTEPDSKEESEPEIIEEKVAEPKIIIENEESEEKKVVLVTNNEELLENSESEESEPEEENNNSSIKLTSKKIAKKKTTKKSSKKKTKT